jgi:hypothetical protein
MFFEVQNEFESYLCDTRIDAFLIGLLPYALMNNHDITSKGMISEKLYYQIQNILIPILSTYISKHNNVNIFGDLNNDRLKNMGAVGTGFSAGVDSFHTLCNTINLKAESYNLTHLTFFNVGSHGNKGGSDARDLYKKRMVEAKLFSEKHGLKFVSVDSNISEIISMSFVQTHTFRSLSAVLALQNLFSVYYYSSGFPIEQFSIKLDSTAYYDLLNVHCLSNENLSFYSTGMVESRLEKVEQISKYEPSYSVLNVCQRYAKNCSNCEKCKRTMLELYSINKLQSYKNVFDVNLFQKKLNEYVGFMLAKKKDKNYQEIILKFKESNIKIPIFAYWHGFKFYIVDRLRRLLKKSKFSRFLYDKKVVK